LDKINSIHPFLDQLSSVEDQKTSRNLFAVERYLRIMHPNFSLSYAFPLMMIPSVGDTNSASFWFEKGNELCNSGMIEEALKAYDHALSIDKTLVDVWNNKGIALASMDKYDEALLCFEEALKISPRHAYTINNKGMILAQQKKYEAALRCFDAAIEVDAYFAGAWYNKSHAMSCLGRGREAKAAMKTAKALDPYGGGCRRR
jgi:tetratricopeptide (TPR) repeat protein